MKILAIIIAIGFMSVMLDILIRAFLEPSYRVSIGESNRWISGLEILMGFGSIGYLVYVMVEE